MSVKSIAYVMLNNLYMASKWILHTMMCQLISYSQYLFHKPNSNAGPPLEQPFILPLDLQCLHSSLWYLRRQTLYQRKHIRHANVMDSLKHHWKKKQWQYIAMYRIGNTDKRQRAHPFTNQAPNKVKSMNGCLGKYDRL